MSCLTNLKKWTCITVQIIKPIKVGGTKHTGYQYTEDHTTGVIIQASFTCYKEACIQNSSLSSSGNEKDAGSLLC